MAQNDQEDAAARENESSESNRRQFDRVVCRVDVTLESDTTFYNGFTENISAGGLFVATYDARHIGQQVKLEFSLPGQPQPISVDGEVRWLRDYNVTTPETIPGMGVRFINLTDRDRRVIEEFIAVREPLFYED